MNTYKRLNTIFSWVVFVIAVSVYFLTMEPTVSWGDPGEHISDAYKLQIGHPPGAPTFGMIGRIFTLFSFGNTGKVAMMINAFAALCSAFTIFFLFRIITILARKLLAPAGEPSMVQAAKILSAGLIGSLTFTFSDSFWFSAVEGNVWAPSLLFTAIVVWAMFKWEAVAEEKHASRWLIFIAFMIGLSIGVHLLNLLAIPALAFIFYFRKFAFSGKGFFLTLIISFALVGFIQMVLIPGIPRLAGSFELLFVNSFGLPFYSGILVYFVVFAGLIITGIWYTKKTGRMTLHTILLSLVFLLIGYSSFITLVIRANAGTPVNQNDPKDPVSLAAYLTRQHYGTWPLLYGRFYSAPVTGYADGTPVYEKDNASGKYIVADSMTRIEPVYDQRFKSFFPRMWSTQRQGAADFYREWGGPGVPVEVTGRDGNPTTINKPTFPENLRYFFTYQVSWMYLRYFMWNFSGRQNDEQSFGGIKNGNWITGIPFLDRMRLGHAVSDLPDSRKGMKSHKYFMLPLILGLAGMFWQYRKNYQGAVVVTLLFFMTGLAIVIYLNQQPFEQSERDYSYAGSFLAFSVWVGLGVIFLMDILMKWLRSKEMMTIIIVAILALILVPGIMAVQNWQDHDRSGKYAARDFGANYLMACDKNAILFTNGDNDTFPVWYNQEVEGVKTDVRVVNLDIAASPWYIAQIYRKVYDSDPLPFTLPVSLYKSDVLNFVPYYNIGINDYIELKDLIDFIKSDDPQTFITLQNGKRVKFFPAKKIKLPVDAAACLKNGIVPENYSRRIADTLFWTINADFLYKNDLMILDIMASNKWERPVYFAAPYTVSNCFGLDRYCHLRGLVYKFFPVRADSIDYVPEMGGVDTERSYDFLVNHCKWGNLDHPGVYIDPISRNNIRKIQLEILWTAQSLVNNGKKKEATEVLDLFISRFPDSKFPYTSDMIPYAETYQMAGDQAKTKAIADRVKAILMQDLDYYASFSPGFRNEWKNEIEAAQAGLGKLSSLMNQGQK